MAGGKPPAQTAQTNETVLLITEADDKNKPKQADGARGKGRAKSTKRADKENVPGAGRATK
eukprot:10441309-Alexandrium_andersonii.AAC.1